LLTHASDEKLGPHPDTEISHKKYGETTIGELRRTYGADFAEGCADHEKLVDVLRKLPSLRGVIRDREGTQFEQIWKAPISRRSHA
jgi:hypothetical protein